MPHHSRQHRVFVVFVIVFVITLVITLIIVIIRSILILIVVRTVINANVCLFGSVARLAFPQIVLVSLIRITTRPTAPAPTFHLVHRHPHQLLISHHLLLQPQHRLFVLLALFVVLPLLLAFEQLAAHRTEQLQSLVRFFTLRAVRRVDFVPQPLRAVRVLFRPVRFFKRGGFFVLFLLGFRFPPFRERGGFFFKESLFKLPLDEPLVSFFNEPHQLPHRVVELLHLVFPELPVFFFHQPANFPVIRLPEVVLVRPREGFHR